MRPSIVAIGTNVNRFPWRATLSLLALGVALLSLSMVTPASAAASEIDRVARAYVTADGHRSRETDTIAATLEPVFGAVDGTARRDDDVSAVEKSLLLLEAQEPALGRVRYMVRYSEAQVDGDTISLVDVRRYNLGPVIRAETIRAYGVDNTAGPDAFGVGPHVGWRIAFRKSSAAASVVIAAGRREIPDSEAASDDCRARKCLDLHLLDDYAQWSQLSRAIGEPAVAYPVTSRAEFGDEEIEDQAPAYVALQLALAVGIASEHSDGMLWSLPQRQGPATDEPLFVIVIDRNLGQEMMTDAALGIPILRKHGEERWVRRSGYSRYRIYETATGPLRRRVE